MKKIREWRGKNPVLAGIIAMALYFILSKIGDLILTAIVVMSPESASFVGNNTYLIQLIFELLYIVLGVVIMIVYGQTEIFTKPKSNFFKGFVPGLYLLIASLYTMVFTCLPYLTATNNNGPAVEWQPVGKIIVFALCTMSIGIAEELVFRGIIAGGIFEKYATDAKGVWFSAFVSAFLFGVMHLMNLSQADPVGVVCQAVMAMAEGLLLTAIYYRCKNIWTVAFIHGFIDFAALSASGLFNYGSIAPVVGGYRPMMMMSMITYLGITAIILRNSKIREMLGKENVHSTPESNKRFKIAFIVMIVIVAVSMMFALLDYTKFISENMNQILNDVRTSGDTSGGSVMDEATNWLEQILK